MYQLFFSSFVDGIFLSFQRILVLLGFSSIIIKPHSTLPLKYMRTSLISTASSRKCDTSKLCSHEVNLELGGNFWRQGACKDFKITAARLSNMSHTSNAQVFISFPILKKWNFLIWFNEGGWLWETDGEFLPPQDGGGGMGIWRDWGAGGALTK